MEQLGHKCTIACHQYRNGCQLQVMHFEDQILTSLIGQRRGHNRNLSENH